MIAVVAATITAITYYHVSYRVPTSTGNHGKSRKSSMHGKIMEFEKT